MRFDLFAYPFQHAPWPRSPWKIHVAAWHSSWISVQRKRSALVNTFSLSSTRWFFPVNLVVLQQFKAKPLKSLTNVTWKCQKKCYLFCPWKRPAVVISFLFQIMSTLSLFSNTFSLNNLYKIVVSSSLWALKFSRNFFASGWQSVIDAWTKEKGKKTKIDICSEHKCCPLSQHRMLNID